MPEWGSLYTVAGNLPNCFDDTYLQLQEVLAIASFVMYRASEEAQRASEPLTGPATMHEPQCGGGGGEGASFGSVTIGRHLRRVGRARKVLVT